MEFLLYILFYIFFLQLVAVLYYYLVLFSDRDKDSFDRSELIDYQKIIPKSIISIFEKEGDMQFGAIALGISSLVLYLWSLMGGMVGEPHYVDSPGNYFFLSCILFAGLAFGYPFIYDGFIAGMKEKDPSNPVVKIFSQEVCLLIGGAVSVISTNVSVYGQYHEIYFFFVLLNVMGTIGILLFRLSKIKSKNEDDLYESEMPYSEDESLSPDDAI